MPRPSPETIDPAPVIQTIYEWSKLAGVIRDETHLMAPGLYGPLYKRVYSGSTTPNFRDLKKGKTKRDLKRALPLLSFSQSIERNRNGNFRNEVLQWEAGENTYHSVTEYSDSQNWDSLPSLRAPDSSGVRNKALTRLSEKMSASVNLGQAFGERLQTATLLADSVERLLVGARDLRRGNIRRALDAFAGRIHPRVISADVKEVKRHGANNPVLTVTEQIAHAPVGLRDWYRKNASKKKYEPKSLHNMFGDLWLEYTYGWKPLVMDVHDSVALLNQKILVPGAKTSVRSTARFEESWVDRDYYFGQQTQHGSVKYSFAIVYDVESELKVVAARTGLTNPALIAWELMPWSFVIDWFVPVGDYLQSLTAFDGFTFTSGTESVVTNQSVLRNYTRVLKSGNAYTGSIQTFSGYRYKRMHTFARTPLATFPSQSSPSFRNPIGNDALTRFGTALSLLNQVIGRAIK